MESLVRELPDAEGARLFYERMMAEHGRVARLLSKDAGLLSDVLALAAWSPFLATTLGQHPDYLSWLARERLLVRVRTAEELGESLARFALTHSQLEPQMLLARFRRRELLRIYLHDLRRTSTLVETTEELSNLADAVLQYALSLAQQELDNLYGSPLFTDARGRTATASFSIVALGKLGSRELNYASDIDLMFLYSDEGSTSGKGTRGSITNREYFVKLAERVARLVGQPTGEGAAYRVDLRLRPHGRDGALGCTLAEALRYYRESAQAWELQALIRSRAAAGSASLYARFAEGVRSRVYRQGETVSRALAHVRLAKQKIDRHHASETRGFNVKLGRGGIREIEFIAQALQLAYGGRDEWLRAPHTLISLGRLHDRGFINERERTALSDAYIFLRTLEHRVQMEQGLQTHLVPDDPARRELLARRMNCPAPDARTALERELARHTANVRAAYERVFGATDDETTDETQLDATPDVPSDHSDHAPQPPPRRSNSIHLNQQHRADATAAERSRAVVREPPADAETAAATASASMLAPRFESFSGETQSSAATHVRPTTDALARLIRQRADASLNARRSLSTLARVAASLDKSDAPLTLSETSLDALIRICGASEFFGEMLASNPLLIPSLTTDAREVEARDYRALLRAAIDKRRSFGSELSALRSVWSQLLVELGACDARGEIPLVESNRLQTALAASSINAAYLIARRELARRYKRLLAGPRLCVLGLGRLGSIGMDYGSDLDLVFIYDEAVPSPLPGLTCEQAYARLVEILVTSLSSLTRDGYLYRVDTRLRPDGKNGALASASRAFAQYLAERAGVWEWLAYVKLRAVAGDMELGRLIETWARRAVHEAAARVGAETLRVETRRIRERLERERTRPASHTIDIKFGAGGMLDVYFATRYLQLRDQIPDEGQDRSTPHMLTRLHAAGSLHEQDFQALHEGYQLLRTLDHHLRLLVGRSTRLPSQDHPALRDLARLTGHASAATLTAHLQTHMRAIRAAYDRITAEDARKV
ncbi:MAG TPA: hypothetical protein VGB73_19565 [Pyrinomonadaceae bacterium]